MKARAVAAGTAFMGTVFVIGPLAMIELNDALGWPRWSLPAGPVIGGGLLLAGFAAVAYCSRLFSSIGRGTPVPLEPPKHMVIEGLYRYSRNPMYVAHAAILLGLFLYRGELPLLLYVGVYLAAMHTWIIRGEEPELRQRFRDEYVAYTQRVPRWIWARRRPLDR